MEMYLLALFRLEKILHPWLATLSTDVKEGLSYCAQHQFYCAESKSNIGSRHTQSVRVLHVFNTQLAEGAEENKI